MITRTWLHIGNSLLQRERFNPIHNSIYRSKPNGGLWLAPLKLNDEWLSDWHEFRGRGGEAVIVTLKKDARILVIDSLSDLKALVKEVGEAPNPRELLLGSTANFEEAAKLYDVIYLSMKGLWETESLFNFGDPNLYGWDVESCVVMNFDAIDKQMPVKLTKHEPAW